MSLSTDTAHDLKDLSGDELRLIGKLKEAVEREIPPLRTKLENLLKEGRIEDPAVLVDLLQKLTEKKELFSQAEQGLLVLKTIYKVYKREFLKTYLYILSMQEASSGMEDQYRSAVEYIDLNLDLSTLAEDHMQALQIYMKRPAKEWIQSRIETHLTGIFTGVIYMPIENMRALLQSLATLPEIRDMIICNAVNKSDESIPGEIAQRMLVEYSIFKFKGNDKVARDVYARMQRNLNRTVFTSIDRLIRESKLFISPFNGTSE